MELIQTKSLLAKLMATENLIVEQRKVATASFDVAKRVLTVPVLDRNLSPYLYDMFMGHEVGHALETPESGMKKAFEMKIPMSIMNVLEDVRIERKIKNKYPGLRISFVKGYRELIEKDFFGTNGADFNDMNFLDRLNLYAKGGAAQGIKFTDEEKVILLKTEKTETYDDVIKLAQEVMKYLKKEEEQKKEKRGVGFEEEDEEDGDDGDDDWSSFDDEYDRDDEWDDTDDEDGSSDSFDEPGQKEKNNDDLKNKGSTPSEGTKSEEDIFKSHTDDNYRKNESKLFASEPGSYYYGNIPNVDINRMVISHKALWKRYRSDVMEHFSHCEVPSSKGIDTESFLKTRNDAKKVVGYLAKEFELRKNADQLKRASESKTGELNMSKIFSYKFSEDIFKKMTIIPDGKSHGLVMFIDWSGSMFDNLENTIKQLINLVMFCKKVNIPYDVYAFTSDYDEVAGPGYRVAEKEGDIYMGKLYLLNLFSSKMSASEFTYAGSALVQMSSYRRGYRPSWFNLGGTPLNETIIAAMKVVPEFQKQYKLQIVNTVFLTDGDGHNLNQVYYKDELDRTHTGQTNDYNDDGYSRFTNRKFVMVDPVSKHQEFCDNAMGRTLTSHYIKMLKRKTGCNIVGFYVLSGREFGREARNFFPVMSDFFALKAKFRKEKCMVVKSAGYDEYYLLRADGLDTDEDVGFEVKENATTRGLVSAFSKYAGNRLNNRVVLNRFVEMIA